MPSDLIGSWWSPLWPPSPFVVSLWVGWGLLVISVITLTYSRWGQSRPIAKCAILSVLVHLLLIGCAYLVPIFRKPPLPRATDMPALAMVIESEELPESPTSPPEQPPSWDNVLSPPLPFSPSPGIPRDAEDASAVPPESMRAVPADFSAPLPAEVLRTELIEPPQPLRNHDAPVPASPLTDMSNEQESNKSARQSVQSPSPLSKPSDRPIRATPATANHPPRSFERERLEHLSSSAKPHELADIRPQQTDQVSTRRPPQITPAVGRVETTPGRHQGDVWREDGKQVPALYRTRLSPDRLAIGRSLGATANSERAVDQALQFLAQAQNPDGRWIPVRWEGGVEVYRDGENRLQAGARADTGITGLALLAFLAAGKPKTYQKNVEQGLDYLISQQGSDGNLFGKAQGYEAMYCHAMALLALGEAYAMSGKSHLRIPLERGVAYSLAAQHPQSGGWRYRPWQQDPLDQGDMSQFGWQLMGLRSAHESGISLSPDTMSRMRSFVRLVSRGTQMGLASYRPNEERVTPSMTAEALFCRFMLGTTTDAGIDEGVRYLLARLPGNDSLSDFYYWYYATLAIFPLQDERWQTWNRALQQELLRRQLSTGPWAGSWSTDTRWGPYGGRIYTTAMATLSLEVYYRYLPMYRWKAE